MRTFATSLHVLHYTFYGIALFSSIKIIVAFKTYKTTPSSRYYSVYCQRYSDYKTLVAGCLSHEKVDENNGNSFLSSL